VIGRILDSSCAAVDSVRAIVVLSGLHEGERVFTGNALFWDAERRSTTSSSMSRMS